MLLAWRVEGAGWEGKEGVVKVMSVVLGAVR